MIGATSGVVSAYLPEPVAREIYGDPRAVTGGVFAPLGTAVAGGRRLPRVGPLAVRSRVASTARGSWAARIVRDDGPPRARMMLFPASEVRDHRHWTRRRASAARAATTWRSRTSFVPAARSVSLIDDRPRERGALYAFPVVRAARARHRGGRARDRARGDRRARAARGREDGRRARAGRSPSAASCRRRSPRPRRSCAPARAFLDDAIDRGLDARRADGDDRRRRARRAAARGDARDDERRARRRPRVQRRRRHVGLRDEPAPALLPRRPRRDAARDGRERRRGSSRAASSSASTTDTSQL